MSDNNSVGWKRGLCWYIVFGVMAATIAVSYQNPTWSQIHIHMFLGALFCLVMGIDSLFQSQYMGAEQ